MSSTLDRWRSLGLPDDNDGKSISMKQAAKTIGLDLVEVKPTQGTIDDINGWITGHPIWDPYWVDHQGPKGQRISEIDPYGEENWDDECQNEYPPVDQLSNGLLLPVAMRIASRTIGLDLVAVQPTTSPRIDLLFVDFKYGENINKEPKGQVFSEIDPYGEENWED